MFAHAVIPFMYARLKRMYMWKYAQNVILFTPVSSISWTPQVWSIASRSVIPLPGKASKAAFCGNLCSDVRRTEEKKGTISGS